MTWADTAADLFLGRACAGCGVPGPLLCEGCRAVLEASSPRFVRPRPTPPGLPLVATAGPYRGRVRRVLHHYKEGRSWALADPLAGRLVRAVSLVLDRALDEDRWDGAGVLTLVPAPSRGSAIRERGLDVTAHLAQRGARSVASVLGLPVQCRTLLRLRTGVADQAGLDTEERRANLRDSMRLVAPPRTSLPPTVVLVDDVVTTGSTLAEMTRMVSATGAHVLGAATLAATIRDDRYPG